MLEIQDLFLVKCYQRVQSAISMQSTHSYLLLRDEKSHEKALFLTVLNLSLIHVSNFGASHWCHSLLAIHLLLSSDLVSQLFRAGRHPTKLCLEDYLHGRLRSLSST